MACKILSSAPVYADLKCEPAKNRNRCLYHRGDRRGEFQASFVKKLGSFEHITLLLQTPEYCALGDGDVHSVNAWLGPPGTVTPLHTDPHPNLLCQVRGVKYVRLYPPSETPRMYPHQSGLNTNSSRVDLRRAGCASFHSDFPEFERACGHECALQPGDALFIPPGWWHYVEACSASVSVSFWWS